MRALGSVNAVVAAIRDEAAAEAERLERAAAAARASLPAEADEPAAASGAARLAAARRAAREALAREDWLDARAALEEREAWLQRATSAGRALLAAPAPAGERRARLLRLAHEALARLPGSALALAVAPADAPLCDGAFAAEAGAGPPVAIEADAQVGEGGCRARTADGVLAFDNGLDARAQRSEPAWRAALGELYGR